jgi:L-rhamnonate dehydratase
MFRAVNTAPAAIIVRLRMKITSVETIYLRLPAVKEQCDSGQDALIVRVHTDAGITGLGEVDSSPMAVKGAIEGPFLRSAPRRRCILAA